LQFSDLPLHHALHKALDLKGLTTPTEIQQLAIPYALLGRDLIASSKTGSGKTLAFLLPAVHRVLTQAPLSRRDPRVLILAPTRELAKQVFLQLKGLLGKQSLRAALVLGGENFNDQVKALKHYPQFIVGTAGRVADHLVDKSLYLNGLELLILDEADRMLDMGFIADIKLLMSLLSSPRQTLLFSATLSKEIEVLAHQFLTDPVRVSIKSRETSAQVDQDIVHVGSGEDKIEVLQKLLAQSHFKKILIFTRTKRGAEKLSNTLFKMGFKAESIHGDKSHYQRQKSLQLFKNNRIEILVATDVAARGLDIPDVSHVINFDLPGSYEDYIHRIGRTGRAGKTGTALTFIN